MAVGLEIRRRRGADADGIMGTGLDAVAAIDAQLGRHPRHALAHANRARRAGAHAGDAADAVLAIDDDAMGSFAQYGSLYRGRPGILHPPGGKSRTRRALGS